MIPSKVVTFWHTPLLPWLAQRCFLLMKSLNAGFHVECLSVPDLQTIIQEDFGHDVNALLCDVDVSTLTNVQKSDLLRVLYMYKHGGVWLDVHCLCTTCLTNVFDMSDDTFQGWTTFQDSIDNWAFACGKQNAFVRIWICEMLKALSNPAEYVTQHKTRFMASSQERYCLLDKDAAYFWVYWASIVAREHHRVRLRESDQPSEPLYYCKTGYEGLFGTALPGLVKLDSTARMQFLLLTRAHLRADKVAPRILEVLNVRTMQEWNRVVRKCPKTKFN